MYEKEKFLIKKVFGTSLYNELQNNQAILAGGAITSLFCDREIQDYDIYFRTVDDIGNVKDYLLQHGYHLFGESHYYNSERAFTLTNDDIIIQLIKYKRFTGNPFDLFRSFDYTVCMGAFEFAINKFSFDSDFFQHNSQRKLVFNTTSKNPINALYRLIKYQNKGYTIEGVELIKLALTIHSLELNTYGDVKESITGINVSLLNDFLKQLKKDKDQSYSFTPFIDLFEEYLKRHYDSVIYENNKKIRNVL